MQSAAYHLSIRTARADALFASALQQSDESSAALVQQAIIAAVRAFGTRGCAARVARAYGERTVTLSVQGRRFLRDQWEIRCRDGSGRRRGPGCPAAVAADAALSFAGAGLARCRIGTRCGPGPRRGACPHAAVSGTLSRSVRLLVEPETDLDGDLEVAMPIVIDPAPQIGDLEPVQVVQGLRGAADGAPNSIIDALGGGTDDLAD